MEVTGVSKVFNYLYKHVKFNKLFFPHLLINTVILTDQSCEEVYGFMKHSTLPLLCDEVHYVLATIKGT